MNSRMWHRVFKSENLYIEVLKFNKSEKITSPREVSVEMICSRFSVPLQHVTCNKMSPVPNFTKCHLTKRKLSYAMGV
jgi:hypothetical protein